MKATTVTHAPSFQPVTLSISITLETQAELDAIYTLFNKIPISRVAIAAGINPEPIYDALSKFGAGWSDATSNAIDKALK